MAGRAKYTTDKKNQPTASAQVKLLCPLKGSCSAMGLGVEGFRGLGFRFLGFRGLGFRVRGLGV